MVSNERSERWDCFGNVGVLGCFGERFCFEFEVGLRRVDRKLVRKEFLRILLIRDREIGGIFFFLWDISEVDSVNVRGDRLIHWIASKERDQEQQLVSKSLYFYFITVTVLSGTDRP